MKSFLSVIPIAFAAIVVSRPLALAHEEQEITVGASAAGQIKLIFPELFEVPPSIFPGISNYASGEIAFHSTILDFPTNDFFQLAPTGDFQFVLLAKDPGMEVWSYGATGFMSVGETYPIGPAPFDSHPVWNIVNSTPGEIYSMTIKFKDLNGIYADSDPYVFEFAPSPNHGPFELTITRIGPDSATLSWSSAGLGWVPEFTEVLDATGWNTITNAPALSGTNLSLNIPLTAPQQFFRLRRVPPPGDED